MKYEYDIQEIYHAYNNCYTDSLEIMGNQGWKLVSTFQDIDSNVKGIFEKQVKE